MAPKRGLNKEVVAFWLDRDVIDQIDERTENRSEFIRASILKQLERGVSPETWAEAGAKAAKPSNASLFQGLDLAPADSRNLFRLLSLLDESGLAVTTKNPDRKLIQANIAAKRNLGLMPDEEVRDKTEEELFVSLGSEAAEAEGAILKGERERDSRVEMRLLRDGRLKFVRSMRVAWVRPDQEVAAVVGCEGDLKAPEKEAFLNSIAPEGEEVIKCDGGVYVVRIKGNKGTHFFDDELMASRVLSKKQRNAAGKPRTLLRVHQSAKRARIRKVLGRSTATEVHDDDLPAVTEFLDGLFFGPKTKKRATVRFRIWRTSSEYKWYSAIGFIVRETGEERYVLISHSEITEGTLASSVAKMLLDKLPAYVFVKDQERRFVFMNERLLNAFRGTLRDVYGKTDLQLGVKAPEDEFFHRADTQVLEAGSPRWFLISSERLTLPNCPPQNLITLKIGIPATQLGFDEGGGGRYILGISFDATEEWNRNEEACTYWRAFMDLAHDAVYVKAVCKPDEDLKYAAVSQTFCDLVGATERTSLIGQTAEQVWKTNPKLVAHMRETDREALKNGKFVDSKPKETVLPDGTVQWRVTTKIRFEDRHKKVYLLGISRDVTSLVEALHRISNP
jgi:PAS domain-containing protein